MSRGRAQFVGAAGQFYLAYGLALREINASLTLGNAPSVDVLASSHDGRYVLPFQVKTSRNAYRRNRYGREGFEWYVNADVIGKHRESFWYAFVDLQEQDKTWKPRIFFIPSRWVAECEAWLEDVPVLSPDHSTRFNPRTLGFGTRFPQWREERQRLGK